MSGFVPENGDQRENPEPEADTPPPGNQAQDGTEEENLEAESELAASEAHLQEETGINHEIEAAEGQSLDRRSPLNCVFLLDQDRSCHEAQEQEATEDECEGRPDAEKDTKNIAENAEAECMPGFEDHHCAEDDAMPVVIESGASYGYRYGAGESTQAEDEQDLNGNNSDCTGAEWSLEPEDSINGHLNADGAEGGSPGQCGIADDEAESLRLELPLETHRTESDIQLAAYNIEDIDIYAGAQCNETVEPLHLIEDLGAVSDDNEWETNSLPEEEDYYGPEGDICLTAGSHSRNEQLETEADQEIELSTGASGDSSKVNQERSDVSCPEYVEIQNSHANTCSDATEVESKINMNNESHSNNCDINKNDQGTDPIQDNLPVANQASKAKDESEYFEPECDQSLTVTGQIEESSQSESEVVSEDESDINGTAWHVSSHVSGTAEATESGSNQDNNVITSASVNPHMVSIEINADSIEINGGEIADLRPSCDRNFEGQLEHVNQRIVDLGQTEVSDESTLNKVSDESALNSDQTVNKSSENQAVLQQDTENASGNDLNTETITGLSNGSGAIPKSRKIEVNDNQEISRSVTVLQNSSCIEHADNSLKKENSGIDSEDELLTELDATLKDNSDKISLQCAISENGESGRNIRCEQCTRNNLQCSLPNGLWYDSESNSPDFKNLKRQLHQAKQLLMERECEISRLKEDVEEKTVRYETMILERDTYQKEVDCLKHQNTDDLYLPQIKELEYTIAQQQAEIRGLKDKLTSHDSAAKKAIAALQSEMKLRVDQITKNCEEVTREKDTMVVKFAQAEHKNLEYMKHAERLDARLKEVEKEKESFVNKFKAVKEHRTKIGAELEAKIAELHNVHKDLDKQREQLSSSDTRVKWAQNKLKAELEAHKETKAQLEKSNNKIKEAKEETQQIRKDCQAMIKTYQESEEVKSNSLDKELKLKESELLAHQQQQNNTELEHVKTLRELEQLKTELAEIKTERSGLKEKITKLETDQDKNQLTINKYSELIQRQKKEIAELRERIENLVHVKSDFTRAQELIKTLDSEISDLKVNNKDLVAEMDACRRRETDKLELTAKLSRKNAELQSENTNLSNKVLNLTGEFQSCKMEYQEVDTKLKDISDALASEKKLREEETHSLNTKLAGKCKAVEDLMRKVEEEKDEIKTLKRKHGNNVKDLTRQLQQVRKKLENYEVTSNGDKDTVSLGSRTSSNGSLNTVGLPEQGSVAMTTPSVAVHQHPAQHVRQPSPEQEYPLITEQVEINKQVLIERIVKLQKMLARKNEKVEFMDDHICQLVDEIQKKNRIIQNYVLREEAGTMTSDTVDHMKAELARKHSIMGSLYSSHSTDGTMTLDLSLEINRKLQAVLEDTLLKNMTLKDSLDTLGQEIARLSQENRSLQLKFQGKHGTRTRPR